MSKKIEIIGKKALLLLLMMIVLLVTTLPMAAYGATRVTVTVPQFKVTLNGFEVNNTYREYPLLVYNSITYFPMTYHDARALGLDAYWDGHTLDISKTEGFRIYQDYQTTNKNSASYQAEIGDFGVVVNGAVVDNGKEEYPLLTFRGVTYFPLTWRFAVNEFGWEYQYDEQNGLQVSAPGAPQGAAAGMNPGTENFTLPYFDTTEMTSANGWLYYYSVFSGKLMAANMSDLTKTEILAELPLTSTQNYPSGSVVHDVEIPLFHMQDDSSRWTYLIDPQTRQLERISGYVLQFGSQRVSTEYGGFYVTENGTKRRLGDESLYYLDIGDSSVIIREQIAVTDDFFIAAASLEQKKSLCRIDRASGKNKVLYDGAEFNQFMVDGDDVYLRVAQGNARAEIVKVNIHTGETTKVDAGDPQAMYSANWAAFNGQVYYGNGYSAMTEPFGGDNASYQAWDQLRRQFNEELYRSGDGNSLSPGVQVCLLWRKDGYLLVCFQEEDYLNGSDSPYKLQVYDRSGKKVAEINAPGGIYRAEVSKGILVYSVYSYEAYMYTIGILELGKR